MNPAEEGGPVELDEEVSGDQIPPPPPPPNLDKPEISRKRKLIVAAAVGVAVVALSLGLGLGLGLRSNEKSGGNGNVASNAEASSGGSDGGGAATGDVGADETDGGLDEGVVVSFTTTTDATTTAFTIADADETATESPFVAAADEAEVADTSRTTTTTAATTTTSDDTATPTISPVEDSATEVPSAVPAAADPTETYDAVVIGAGWSGIRATETLLDQGVENVLVLEAADYVGGRAKSINLDDSANDPNAHFDSSNVPYDFGCEWLYNKSPMGEALVNGGYLNSLALGSNQETTALTMKIGQFYQQKKDANGGLTAEVMEDAAEWMDEIWYNGFMRYRENRLDELDGKSYAEAIDQFIEDWGWTDDESLQFLNMMEDGIENEYTGDSSRLDINEIEFNEEGYTIETMYMSTAGLGYGNVATKYAEDRFASKIKLNSKVVEINDDESDEEVAIVKYVEAGVAKSVKARTVLVTVSLGVLKSGVINFIPSLPDRKQESIDNMGFGLVNKCTMTWDNDEDLVWPEDELWFILMTPEDETSGLWTTFWNPSKFKGKPSLTAWISGNDAIEEEEKTDEEILDNVMRNLKSMFPSIREPDRVLITRWGMDENVRGAYSHPVPGRSIYDDADYLQEPFGRIFFSGEATGSGWATTMGAWNTGEKAAENMIELLQTI